MGKLELHADRIAAWFADQVLTIDAWDQSSCRAAFFFPD
jgi:hypothetical protein